MRARRQSTLDSLSVVSAKCSRSCGGVNLYETEDWIPRASSSAAGSFEARRVIYRSEKAAGAERFQVLAGRDLFPVSGSHCVSAWHCRRDCGNARRGRGAGARFVRKCGSNGICGEISDPVQRAEGFRGLLCLASKDRSTRFLVCHAVTRRLGNRSSVMNLYVRTALGLI
jgi:hypothetical protein